MIAATFNTPLLRVLMYPPSALEFEKLSQTGFDLIVNSKL
jgi:hypothetical protein